MKLINCTYPEINYHNGKRRNPPINIDTVTHFDKGKSTSYNDTIGYSTIVFHFIGGTQQEWFYPHAWKYEVQNDPHQFGRVHRVSVADTAERDKEYDNLVKIFSIPNQVSHD